ncbi:MAG: ATP-binding cassette domain-containing protein [Candidatus Aminicenantes bacterium]|nr:ATP-binding cassette domain-containing protein [Candidatus Aminicenantes bacterium]NIM81572.1 ATP-binding cassette domain-containing protein [Candidatus Aminicenantes bacterium]NIN20943.1 ATP-binding cassette domain-containing protein [Candidatus Aminicenantes bacterium]NIN44764.1 ATP-binding cassette domain-containing protein [Candidatus Aminicenantes bacterium]NIN87572.1 ATP-binding cassette domain-containing protein [Candidatus Aminicenantes bacterium]
MEEPEQLTKKDWRLLKRLLPYLKKHVILVTVTVVFMLIMDITGVLHPYLIKLGIDRDVANGDLQGLGQTALILLIVLVSSFLFQVFFNYAVQYLGQKLLYDLRLDLFKHMIHLSNDYFDKTPVGKTLTNITNDVESIREFISEGVVSVIGELLKVFFILAAMMMINFKLAMLAFIMLPFFAIITILFRKSIRTGYRGVRKANSQINTALQESITGIREIIQFNYKEKSKENFEKANRYYLESFLKVVHAYSLYFPVIEVVSNISMVIILFFAHLALGVSVRVGEIFAFFSYINMFFRPLRQLAERFNMFQAAMAAAERTFRLLDQDVTIKNPDNPRPIPLDFKGKITFKNVHFAYKPENPVLRDISFEIQPGEKVALVGYTGSGKTTIINLINRLYDIQSGSILIDGIPVREYDMGELRSRISTVPQDPFLFTGTVAENISMYDPSISLKDIVEAAQTVNADQFIKQLPDKYDENVLEEGKRLSVGQKQLVSFARGVVRKPDIFILDEATSNIDSETEKLIDAAIEKLLEGRTAIIIAHRLSTIRKVDRILVFNKGCLVEEGSHEELLRNGGIYNRLYQTQAFSLN